MTKKNADNKTPIRIAVTTIQQLFEIAGSSTKLAASLDLHAYTVENWRRNGVPQKYWDELISKYKITTEELHAIGKNCRND